MNDRRQMNDTDEELIDTLLAISVVSKRLARNLSKTKQFLCAITSNKENCICRENSNCCKECNENE